MLGLDRPFVALRGIGRDDLRFVGLITGGHIVIHWHQGIYPVVIPTIKAALGLTDVDVGVLSAARQFTSGLLNLPSGIVADALAHHRASIMAAAILVGGIGYTIMGVGPGLWAAAIASMLVGLGACLWHPAAQSSLASKFPNRRATVLSIHGTGATVSDSVTPLVVGALLASFAWQSVLAIQLIPALLISAVFMRLVSGSFRRRGRSKGRTLIAQFREVGPLLANAAYLGISIANGFWVVGRVVVLTFLPIYLQDHLGYSTVVLGFYVALLNVLGIFSQGVLGLLSDRFGRKVVAVPSFAILGVLYILLGYAPPGLALGSVIAAIGIFFYTLTNVTSAAIFDTVDKNVAASAQGLTSLLNQVMVLPAPVVAGLMVGIWGIGSTFVLSGVLMLVGALVMMPLRMYRGSHSVEQAGIGTTSDEGPTR